LLATDTIAVLVCVVLAAFTVETALGFGATLISLALGSLVVPIESLLPALVPLNLALSIFLSARYAPQIDRAFLFRRLLPMMALGLPIGLFVFREADSSLLKRLFGVFLAVVSASELWRMRASSAHPAPLSRPAEIAMLIAGGIVHGAFAAGGPMAVYVTSRAIHDKGAYRATLCVLWAVLNVVLLTTYGLDARIDRSSMLLSACLAPSCAIGLALGELAHRRVPIATFRVLVFVLLALAGAMLVVRG
jgi:uncharacterized protein